MKHMYLVSMIVLALIHVHQETNAQVTCLYYRIAGGNSVEIHWCFFGINNYGSEVQRRSVAGTFETRPNSFCPGSSLPHECVYSDGNVPAGESYYRIKMIALDGLVTYSDSITVMMDLSQADYVIIAPPAYVSTMLPLASFRSSHNGFNVRIATTDSIYGQFGQGIPADSAIRQFITFALTAWENPKPQYFLFGGNVNAVPSHREEDFIVQGDTISVDEWFVEGPDTTLFPRPAAALGRLPAWNQVQLQTMVMKTIDYENLTSSAWMSRVIEVADYDSLVGFACEQLAAQHEAMLVNLWPDTMTVHVRESSSLHRTRAQFRDLWNQGAAIINLVGPANSYQFSQSAYFTTRDADSLSNGPRLPFFLVQGGQRFERPDTLPMVVNLMQVPSKGIVASYAPCAPVYADGIDVMTRALFQQMTGHPGASIGKSILAVKFFLGSTDNWRRYTLFGDPALVVKNPVVAHVQPEPGVPKEFALSQNYPNPFNPSTNIRFHLPALSAQPGQAGVTGYGLVTLKVYDVLGREVRTLVNEKLKPGSYETTFEATSLSSGVYFYRLVSGAFTQTRKLILLR